MLVLFALSGTPLRPQAAVSPPPATAATPTGTASPTTAAATTAPATPTPGAVPACENRYQQGDVPIVPPRASGRFLQVALDSVVVIESQQRTRWSVRFFDPSNAPGNAEIPLQARITDAPGRSVTVVPDYEAGAPNSGPGRVTASITLRPCGARQPAGTSLASVIVLVIQSATITSGRYTLAIGPVLLPEGGTRDEVLDVTLTCDARPGPTGVCR